MTKIYEKQRLCLVAGSTVRVPSINYGIWKCVFFRYPQFPP
ncbi:hypothetical protein X975_14637, partial [Stegodyphus mimosarum]